MVYNAVLSFVCLLALALSSHAVSSPTEDPRPYPCNSEIYCYGRLLHTVQMNSPYNDSKTFVDMKMKWSEERTLQLFDEMMNETNNKPTKQDIEVFLEANFDNAGSEFEAWVPQDWIENPKFLSQIQDPTFKQWGSDLNKLWKELGRQVKKDVHDHQEQYSLIYVPNPVIVPGGRFREFYYWDSYWIVKGLLHSQMYTTVKGMLENFLSIVDTYGFIPNGGRIYYERRSQPPLLIPMMQAYHQATNDTEFIRKNIATLEREFDFWVQNHTVIVDKYGKKFKLARYGDYSKGPRPESYSEDYETAHHVFQKYMDLENYYSELKAAAESGWDFSSRWFILNGTNQGNITNLKTRYIIPVDLNAILYGNAKILGDFYHILNDHNKTGEYKEIAHEWMTAVTEVLWHEEVGAWLDYDILNERKRDYFHPSNIAPLWTGCYPTNNEQIVNSVMKYLQNTQIMNNYGGIPTTLQHSGEQWDYPNAWPPLQHIMIMGLDSTGDAYAQDLAYEMAERWVRANYIGYENEDPHAMFEKYDATIPGGYGGGGEYALQVGFGWTNGVIMDLLAKYGDRLTAEEVDEVGESNQGISAISHSAYPAVVCVCLALASCLG
ncbi:hypothetical protein B566_EDAN016032 [Ephemera danica]|nr:hypothetical protein B566_EDAN016032 [Ephemera danica]